jgi:hypothetical protein
VPPELTLRQQVLLSFLAASDEESALDPVRVMKGLFLIDQEAPREWLPVDARYVFEPYLYGPFSTDVYRDLDHLTGLGYAVLDLRTGRSWTVTPSGRALATSTSNHLPAGLRTYIREVRTFVSSASFRDLLNAVYERYPHFATKSVFRR